MYRAPHSMFGTKLPAEASEVQHETEFTELSEQDIRDNAN